MHETKHQNSVSETYVVFYHTKKIKQSPKKYWRNQTTILLFLTIATIRVSSLTLVSSTGSFIYRFQSSKLSDTDSKSELQLNLTVKI